MIDTDKYEGHTEGPWKLHYDDSAIDGAHLDYGAQLDPVGALHAMSVANARLIADSPLLLEEVKRLRKALKDAEDVIRYALEMSSDDDSTRVFEDYLELIE